MPEFINIPYLRTLSAFKGGDLKDPRISSCTLVPNSFFTLDSGPKIPAWNHMAVAHRDTDQSGLNGPVYNIQSRLPQHQNTGNQVFSVMLYCFQCWGFSQNRSSQEPLLTRLWVIHRIPSLWTRPIMICDGFWRMIHLLCFLFDTFISRSDISHSFDINLFGCWLKTRSCTTFSLSWKTTTIVGCVEQYFMIEYTPYSTFPRLFTACLWFGDQLWG